jgi:hypothetical protein
MQRIIFTSKKLCNSKKMLRWLPATWRKAKKWYDGFLQVGGSQNKLFFSSSSLTCEHMNLISG